MPEDFQNPERNAARMKDSYGDNRADAELLKRISERDEAAMAAIFDRYAKMVYSIALRVLHDPAEAEDVMQEVLMQIWRGPQSFVSGQGSLGGWLAVVARNRAIDVLRRRHPSGQGPLSGRGDGAGCEGRPCQVVLVLLRDHIR